MDTLRELFHETLKDVYFAETAITKALPKMEKAASAKELRAAFRDHLEETKGQIERLKQVFAMLGEKPEGKECPAIKGLLQESDELMHEKPEASVLDAGLLAGSQAVEHYEMARYGTLRAWADCLGMTDAARLLEQTLSEEKSTDAKLSVLAVSSVNKSCAIGIVEARQEHGSVKPARKAEPARSDMHDGGPARRKA